MLEPGDKYGATSLICLSIALLNKQGDTDYKDSTDSFSREDTLTVNNEALSLLFTRNRPCLKSTEYLNGLLLPDTSDGPEESKSSLISG